ncbi:MAG: SMC-Scp complex subunit ScpB [Bdellovibrio sp.]|jgi:segregation and condensation protein B
MKKNKKEDKLKFDQIEESAETLSEELVFAENMSSDEASELELEAAMAFEGLVAEEPDSPSFLPEATDDILVDESSAKPEAKLEGTELEAFESAEIEDVEFVEEERLDSIVESVMFASDRPVSLHQLKLVFKGTNIKSDKIRKALDRLAVELAGSKRGVTLEEVPGGYQLRTKIDNMTFLTRTLKARPFKVSGPALEVLAIVAYKQPVIKAEIDEIRGVESGHLMRALMEKGLVNFEGKSDLPGKPMLYGTTRKFLEIFGLRNLKELPTLSQIDELLPEGIDEVQAEKPTLSQITDSLSQQAAGSYSDGEEELLKISGQLEGITTSSDFFEAEKLRQKQKRDEERAGGIREALLVGESVSTRDRNWLIRYDEALQAGQAQSFAKDELFASGELKAAPTELEQKVQAFENDSDHESASFDSELTADDEELSVPYHDDEDGDSDEIESEPGTETDV